ncbi:MAG: type II toxin-antitoxin system RelE/ParE family toxin [Ignavibacteria bacterium]|nr:type II toxin-antitoxin system RelE/ParE family toxin [Ignavibacteria bacterium]
MNVEVIWTEKAETNYEAVKDFLKENWSKKVLKNFTSKVENLIEHLKVYTQLGEKVEDYPGVRKFLVTKQNYIYYKFIHNKLYIVNFVDTRQSKT